MFKVSQNCWWFFNSVGGVLIDHSLMPQGQEGQEQHEVQPDEAVRFRPSETFLALALHKHQHPIHSFHPIHHNPSVASFIGVFVYYQQIHHHLTSAFPQHLSLPNVSPFISSSLHLLPSHLSSSSLHPSS